MKIAVTNRMMNRVTCDEELFQTVGDERGSLDEGMMTGNIVSPTEEMTPRIAMFENISVETARPVRTPGQASAATRMPITGATTIRSRSA